MPEARRARRLLAAAAIVGALLLGLAFALPRLVDVDRHRPRIASALAQATGRQVRLGRISVSVLPVPGLSVESLAVADAARYPGRDALRAERLSLRLDLAGLLRGRLGFRSILIARPTITLIRDARGRWNFDDLLARAAAAPSGAGAARSGAGAAGSGESLSLTVDRAEIRGGRVQVYDDAVSPGSRAEVVLRPIDAALSGWGSGGGDLDLSVGLGGSRLRVAARFAAGDAGRRLDARVEAGALRAADLLAVLPWAGIARPAGIEVGGALNLSGTATIPLDRPEAIHFKGVLDLEGLSYRDAGMARPLSGLGGRLTVDGDHATWEDFTVTLGTSTLSGRLQVEDFLRPRIGFTIGSSRLDAGEVIAAFTPAAGTAPGAARPAGRPGPAAPASGAPAAPGFLEQLGARGRLTIEALRFQTFDLADVRASAVLSRGVLTLERMEASLYGGTLGGTARVELARAVPSYGLEIRLEAVEVNPALTAFDPDLKDLLRGRLTGRLDLAAAGAGMEAILASARGGGFLEVSRGAITSFSVLKQIAGLLEAAGGKGIGKEETPFEFLRGHLAIGDRRARTEALALHSADLDLEGAGWVGLDASLGLGVKARFSKQASEGMVAKNAGMKNLQDGEGRVALHFRLQGSLASPSFKLDASAQIRQVGESAKEKLKTDLLDRLRKSLGGAEPEPSPAPSPGPSPGPPPGP
jgi:AsmA protein